jgi:hypothetical protein
VPTYLLPPMYDVLIAHQALPSKSLDPRAHAWLARHVVREELAAASGERQTLGDEMVADEAEGSVGEDAGTDVREASVAGAQAEGTLGEAMLGNVLVGGGQNGLLDGGEGSLGGRVVVGVERAVFAEALVGGAPCCSGSYCCRVGAEKANWATRRHDARRVPIGLRVKCARRSFDMGYLFKEKKMMRIAVRISHGTGRQELGPTVTLWHGIWTLTSICSTFTMC